MTGIGHIWGKESWLLVESQPSKPALGSIRWRDNPKEHQHLHVLHACFSFSRIKMEMQIKEPSPEKMETSILKQDSWQFRARLKKTMLLPYLQQKSRFMAWTNRLFRNCVFSMHLCCFPAFEMKKRTSLDRKPDICTQRKAKILTLNLPLSISF